MKLSQLRTLALSLPEVTEEPHFEKTSFRVRKKIFATVDKGGLLVNLKLNEIDQSVFCEFDTNIIYPNPSKWGKRGWTIINLHRVPDEMMEDALKCAYCAVAPKKLVASITSKES